MKTVQWVRTGAKTGQEIETGAGQRGITDIIF